MADTGKPPRPRHDTVADLGYYVSVPSDHPARLAAEAAAVRGKIIWPTGDIPNLSPHSLTNDGSPIQFTTHGPLSDSTGVPPLPRPGYVDDVTGTITLGSDNLVPDPEAPVFTSPLEVSQEPGWFFYESVPGDAGMSEPDAPTASHFSRRTAEVGGAIPVPSIPNVPESPPSIRHPDALVARVHENTIRTLGPAPIAEPEAPKPKPKVEQRHVPDPMGSHKLARPSGARKRPGRKFPAPPPPPPPTNAASLRRVVPQQPSPIPMAMLEGGIVPLAEDFKASQVPFTVDPGALAPLALADQMRRALGVNGAMFDGRDDFPIPEIPGDLEGVLATLDEVVLEGGDLADNQGVPAPRSRSITGLSECAINLGQTAAELAEYLNLSVADVESLLTPLSEGEFLSAFQKFKCGTAVWVWVRDLNGQLCCRRAIILDPVSMGDLGSGFSFIYQINTAGDTETRSIPTQFLLLWNAEEGDIVEESVSIDSQTNQFQPEELFDALERYFKLDIAKQRS